MAKIKELKVSIEKINYLLIGILLACTLLVYWPSLDNKLTNWDDKEYITERKSLSDASFKKHFSEEKYVMGNFHPLAMWSLAIDYRFAYDEKTKEINPVPFHRTNLFLHVLSTFLVFVIIFQISGNNIIAGITAALFALHPMHVESVAWAAERKDVLYVFFYLLALVCWNKFIDRKKNYLFYGLTFLCFVLACLSKAVAVSLPLLLIGLDYYKGRTLSVKLLLEKIPFLALSVVFGLIAIEAQKEFEALQGNDIYPLGTRILFAGYGTMQYILKFWVPANLSCFYPFPNAYLAIPGIYYLGIIFSVGIAAALWFFRKNKALIFSAVWFFSTVGLVLQLLPVGGAVIADRYSYLPHVGIGFLMGWGVVELIKRKPDLKNLLLGISFVFCLLMAYLTYERTKIWSDSITLWIDAESKDQSSPKTYSNLGDAYLEIKDYPMALQYMNRSLELKPDYREALYNRGLIYFFMKQYQESINDYTAAIKVDPNLKVAYHNRAGTYFTVGMYKEALADALKAQELGYPVDPQFIQVLQENVAKSTPGK